MLARRKKRLIGFGNGLQIRPGTARRIVFALCLAAAGAGAANAQCYELWSHNSGASLKVDITTMLSVIGPINLAGGGRSFNYAFIGNYTLTTGQSTQTSTGMLGGSTILYSGSPLFTTVNFTLADPAFHSDWIVDLQGSGDLMPKGLPQTLPDISKWTLPSLGTQHDYLAIGPTGSVKQYILDEITGCTVSGVPTISLSVPELTLSYTLGGVAPPPQVISISNSGTGTLAWTASANVSWITLSQTSSTLTVSVNPAGLPPGGYVGVITITAPGATNSPFPIPVELTVNSAGAGLTLAGSMAHLASGGGWDTTLTLVNTGTTTGEAMLNFFGNDGGPLQLPFNFLESNPPAGPLTTSTLDQPLYPTSMLIVDSQQPTNPNAQVGSAQLLTSGHVDGFAIFKYAPTGQEAVVPLETRNAPSYLLAFDNTGTLKTGIAIANVATQPASIPIVIRDDTGTQIGADHLSLSAQGHTSFMLTDNYNITKGKRGTIELDTPTSGQITALGLRANGSALTTLPVLARVTAGGGSMAHVASGGGWQTTFTLVNTGTTPAQVQLSFYDNSGNTQSLPLTFVQQSNTASTASTVSQTIAPGATLVILTQGSNAGASVVGSAQLTTTGNLGGFAIFRYNPTGQEAVVPLETRNANSYVLAFDNTNGLVTGVALANVTNHALIVPVAVRDDAGSLLVTAVINLAANGHTSFLLTDNYPASKSKRGTVEFVTPPGTQISVLGLRATPGGAVTTVPVLAK